MRKYTYPFRVGRKQKRAILDGNGLEVVIFPEGNEELAQLTCDLLNRHNKPPMKFKAKVDVSSAISDAKKLKEDLNAVDEETASRLLGILPENNMLDRLKETLSTPEGIEEAREWFDARHAEEPEIPKGWVSIEDHLPQCLAMDFVSKGYSEYKVRTIDGQERISRVTDHNMWYCLAKDSGITHWWHE